VSLNASDVGAQFDGERAKTVAGRGGSGKGLRRRRGRDRRVIQRCCYAVEKHLPAGVCLKTSSTVIRFCFLWGPWAEGAEAQKRGLGLHRRRV
jgi:hypothetical protein